MNNKYLLGMCATHPENRSIELVSNAKISLLQEKQFQKLRNPGGGIQRNSQNEKIRGKDDRAQK